MRKIAIYGGTFNPIHNGHIHLARQFAQLLGLDKVILIPTRVPPHKQASNLAPAKDRLAMCSLAASDSIFEVSDMEIRRDGLSYTVDTLLELKRQCPESELYLITGEDMFVTVLNWYHAETICSLATICAAPRSTAGLDPLLRYARILEQNGAKTIIKNIDYLPISSTMVRNTVKNGESISKLVPPAVADYIVKNNLYLECGK